MIEDLSDVIMQLASGTYVVTRQPAAVFVDGVVVSSVVAPTWEPLQNYQPGAQVSWMGDAFEAATMGDSSADQPPTGRGEGIVDGSLTWNWLGLAAETFTITASVQPLSGRELDRLPELLRTREVRTLFTTSALRVCSAGGEGDLVAIDGEVWEVQSPQDWSTFAAFTRCLVARRGR